jgi:hypothetical protein
MKHNAHSGRRAIRSRWPAAAVVALSCWLSGCSSQQMYATGQAWQRSLCNQQSFDARTRCHDDANRSYDSYRRETAPAVAQ